MTNLLIMLSWMDHWRTPRHSKAIRCEIIEPSVN